MPNVMAETPPSSSGSGLPVRLVSSRPLAPLASYLETWWSHPIHLFRNLLLLLLIRRFERKLIQPKEGRRALPREFF